MILLLNLVRSHLPESRREAARGNAILVDYVAAAVQRRDARVDLRCTAGFVAFAGHRVAVLCVVTSAPGAGLAWLVGVVLDTVAGDRVPLGKSGRAGRHRSGRGASR